MNECGALRERMSLLVFASTAIVLCIHRPKSASMVLVIWLDFHLFWLEYNRRNNKKNSRFNFKRNQFKTYNRSFVMVEHDITLTNFQLRANFGNICLWVCWYSRPWKSIYICMLRVALTKSYGNSFRCSMRTTLNIWSPYTMSATRM